MFWFSQISDFDGRKVYWGGKWKRNLWRRSALDSYRSRFNPLQRQRTNSDTRAPQSGWRQSWWVFGGFSIRNLCQSHQCIASDFQVSCYSGNSLIITIFQNKPGNNTHKIFLRSVIPCIACPGKWLNKDLSIDASGKILILKIQILNCYLIPFNLLTKIWINVLIFRIFK